VRIDLHTHSSVSDGTDRPDALVRRAHEAGLDVVAITDHDTAESWADAERAAAEVGITLVRGMEISTRLGHASVHLLAYLPDPTYPPLAQALTAVLDGRNDRVPAICARLQALGVPVTEHDVRRRAGDAAATGRPHVADAMIAAGVVGSREEAFTTWLNPGRPAYVDRWAVPLEEAIALVTGAGGVSVVAHPWGRSRVLTAEQLERLAGLGLGGIEVDHQDHPEPVRTELRGLADDLGLVATGSSDHHGLGKVDHDLGCNTTTPAALERLLHLAGDAATASGRPTPAVLVP
jgi:3',5'-nucleoside bisphosphate phosphatase